MDIAIQIMTPYHLNLQNSARMNKHQWGQDLNFEFKGSY